MAHTTPDTPLPEASMSDAAAIEAAVVAAAIAIARDAGFEAVRLSAVAERSGIPLAIIGDHFRDVDAIANAWFKSARRRLLSIPFETMEGATADERLARVMETWLEALQSDRTVAVAIIQAKLHPSHAHHWVPLIFDLSRLVHDFLDVARVPGQGRFRAAQEIALTGITLAMLRDWAKDQSPDASTTRRRLRRRLAGTGRLVRHVCSKS